MRDLKMVPGKKRYYDDLEDAITDVAKVYPGARREGSVGAWHWESNGEVVAEAWLHATKPGWWVRVKPTATPVKGDVPFKTKAEFEEMRASGMLQARQPPAGEVVHKMPGIIRDVLECASQAEDDLCGEQREFHLPRLRRIKAELTLAFPVAALMAMKQAKDVYGRPLFKPDSEASS